MKKIIKGKSDKDSFAKKAKLEISDSGIVSKNVMSAKGKAEQIVDAAKKEADALKARAQSKMDEVEGIRKQAYEEGKKLGREEGMAELTEQLTKVKKMREDFLKESEPQIMKLVMAVAEKVIGTIVDENQKVISDVVWQALEHSLGDRIVVKVSPEDYQFIIDQDIKFKDELDRTKRLVFKQDESVSKGGCIVETEVGTIDAQLETQMAAIKRALGI